MRMRRKKNLDKRLAECGDMIFSIESEDKNFNTAIEEKEYIDLEKWFGNSNPVRLEVGCGKGKFTVETAEAEPDVLLIAIERVQDALVLAMEAAIRKGLKNVFFVSLDAANIDQFFADDEIDLLYINFCDPWPRKKNAKRRLTYHTFLEKYKKVLKLGGQIHFKTDNANLFAWSLPEMESCFLELRNVTDDLHANGPVGIMTGYEEKFYALGTPIHRVEAVITTKQPRPAEEKPDPENAEK